MDSSPSFAGVTCGIWPVHLHCQRPFPHLRSGGSVSKALRRLEDGSPAPQLIHAKRALKHLTGNWHSLGARSLTREFHRRRYYLNPQFRRDCSANVTLFSSILSTVVTVFHLTGCVKGEEQGSPRQQARRSQPAASPSGREHFI